MHETITFPVAYCAACSRDVIVGHELDEEDRWVGTCTRCGAVVSLADARSVAPATASALGYALGDGDDACGADRGCGSCGTPIRVRHDDGHAASRM